MKSKINVPTIPVLEAQARVTKFREKFAPQAQTPEDVPRAVLIPIDDLLAIISKYESLDADGNVVNTLMGVRAYFAINDSDPSVADKVTVLVVPVDLKGNDLCTDKVYGDGDPGDDGSDIFDFTKPCPDMCDPDSPLYIP